MDDYFILIFLCIASKGVAGVTLTVVNSCGSTIWPGLSTGSINSTGFELPTQTSRTIQAPTGWGGRIWGRTGCTLNGSDSFSCQTGDCGSGEVECNGALGDGPVTSIEFNLAFNPPVYDVSLVDGFNLPVLVEGTGGLGQCPWTGCTTDLNLQCPAELTSNNGSACRTACQVFQSADYCCSPPYGSPQTCRQSVYSEVFKAACPKAYSKSFDDTTSLYMCTNVTHYTITFCPSSSYGTLFKVGVGHASVLKRRW